MNCPTTILPKGPIARLPDVTLGIGSTMTVDALPFDQFLNASYQIAIHKVNDDPIKHMMAFVGKTGGDLEDTVYARLGGSANVSVSFYKSGSSVILEMTNGEAFALVVSLVRTLVTTT